MKSLNFIIILCALLAASQALAQNSPRHRGSEFGYGGVGGHIFGKLTWAEDNCNGQMADQIRNESILKQIGYAEAFNRASYAAKAEIESIAAQYGVPVACNLINEEYGDNGTIYRWYWEQR